MRMGQLAISFWSLTVIQIIYLFSLVQPSFIIPGMRTEVYFRPGDLVLGGLFRVHRYSSSDLCGEVIQSQKQFQYHEAMVHAIGEINKRNDILPNTTLGFSILDDCTKDQAALARAMSWIPPAPCCNCTNSASSPYYNVVGVVSGTNSQNTLTAAGLLNIFSLPMVGAVSTSELLSDKSKYYNFLRVVPSDRFQAKVIIDILLRFNWTYISAINSPGGYGEIGIKAVKALADENGICIAFAHEIDRSKGEEEYDRVLQGLRRFPNARAVVMFVQGTDGRGVIAAAHRANVRDHFIWITSDGVGPGSDLAGLEMTAAGGFHVQLYSTGAPGFPQYFENLSPYTSDNPWISRLFESVFDCRVNTDREEEKCNASLTMADIPGYSPYQKTALFLDTVKTFSHALHEYIIDHCPDAFGHSIRLAECINVKGLRPYLYNVTFYGSYGRVQFDRNGDADGKYAIDQLQKHGDRYTVTSVGVWDKSTETLTLDKPVYWNTGDVMPDFDSQAPESLCSKPCKPGEFYVQLELKCCWNCRRCRDNEITVENASSCEECPLFTWPDDETFATCIDIPPTYLQWLDILPIVCLIVGLLGILSSLSILAVYVIHWSNQLIKATSRELSLTALAGNVVSYLAAIFVIIKPTDVSCYIGRLGFNISIAVVYASLLVKTSRIYRLFRSAKRSVARPKFTSTRSQIAIVLFLISLQIVTSSVTTILAPPVVTLHMPVPTEKYVELLCALPMEGFIPSLIYNLLLITPCIVYAFKARKLPDNYNESRYIFLTVCTTIFLWIAFLPTYFSAFYATQKALLLATMLLLNATVILMCLYLPKVYAIYYVDEDTMQLTNMTMKGGNNATKVGPAPATQSTNTSAQEAIKEEPEATEGEEA